MKIKNKFLLLVALIACGPQLYSVVSDQDLREAEDHFAKTLGDYFAQEIKAGNIVIDGWENENYFGKADLIRKEAENYCSDPLFLGRISDRALTYLRLRATRV